MVNIYMYILMAYFIVKSDLHIVQALTHTHTHSWCLHCKQQKPRPAGTSEQSGLCLLYACNLLKLRYLPHEIRHTVKILKFGTPQTIAIIVLRIGKFDVTLH